MVLHLRSDERGKVVGVDFADSIGQRHHAKARTIMLAAGAIETPRLLLNSPTDREPNGLGNNNDLVGRNLQGHYYPGAYGLFDKAVHSSVGPGVSIATTAFSHGNPGLVGGGMLADDFVRPPILFFKQFLPPDLSRWGQEAKNFMRDNYNRAIRVIGPVHEIPTPDARVQVARSVKDGWGVRVATLSGGVHPETLRTATYMHEKATAWLSAAGAIKTWGSAPVSNLSGGHHQAGTCRMGIDAKASVTDPFGRVWGHDNLFICDGSLHPTNGGFNPVLTILALAFRTAEHIVSVT
jgi:choline dehydrogenase-like flavoprotein